MYHRTFHRTCCLDKTWHLAYTFFLNFLIIKHHKRIKGNGNFQDILMYREEFPDKKAEVMLIKTELGIAKLFLFFHF